ncbi:MAG TPA: tetratricopeptide repeat protein [Terracidiphilus sp.]|jgi:tetratricopeptide (TPR) repeat protein|nr:tetratricopeptide repeat protein [Terracidiphilus sp.]
MRPRLFFAAALLLLLLPSPSRASAPQWLQISSPHFTLYTDGGEKKGRHLLDQFERMRWVFRTLFPNVNDPVSPVIVIATRDKQGFQALEPAAYLAKGQIVLGGLFLKTQDQNYVLVRLDVENEEHPFAIVYHEYTHFEFSASIGWMPLWLNEGMAQFFENSEIRDKDVRMGEPSTESVMALRQSGLIPLPVLLKVDATSPYYHQEQKGTLFYAESWALTHMLMIDDRMHKTAHLDDYMRLLAQHQDPVAAAQQVWGDLKKLETALSYYIQKNSYTVLVLNSAAAPIDESSWTVRALAPADADAARAGVLVSVGRFADARSMLDSVLKQDPNNALACEDMGMLALRQNDQAEARKWYAQAVKLDSKSYLAHYYFAAMSMSQGSSEDADVESSLRQAIALNPTFAPAYNQLAMYYGMRREHMDDALKLITKAVQLDPSSVGYRLNAASVLEGMGHFEEAEKVLQAALKVARNPQDASMVQERISQVAQISASMAQRDNAVVSAEPEGSPQVIVVNKETGPRHPTEPPTGPRHTAEGVMKGVTCGNPSILEFQVVSPKKTVSVYTNNYFQLDVSALGFTPNGSINPCSDFEGRPAKVQYAEVSDKTVDGQVVSVELHK